MLFSSVKSAKDCACRLHRTQKMGKEIEVVIDAGGRIRKREIRTLCRASPALESFQNCNLSKKPDSVERQERRSRFESNHEHRIVEKRSSKDCLTDHYQHRYENECRRWRDRDQNRSYASRNYETDRRRHREFLGLLTLFFLVTVMISFSR